MNVSAVAPFVAFGCVLLAAVMNQHMWLLVAAVGLSVVAVVAAFALMSSFGLFMTVLTVLLTVFPVWLLREWWVDGQ